MNDTISTNGKHSADLTPTSGGYQADTSPTREKEKSLLVKPRTHEMVRAAAKRLGRPTDAVVRAGIRLLNEKTADEKAVKDDDWADSIGGKS